MLHSLSCGDSVSRVAL